MRVDLTPFLTSTPFIVVVCAVLALWAAIFAYRLRLGQTKVVAALTECTGRLQQGPNDTSFSARFEAISADLAQNLLLGAAWRDFRETLIVPADPGRPVYMTERPEPWFDLTSLFRRAGRDMRFHAAFPGILVGAGLLFTFLGLTIALGRASGVVSDGNTTQRLAALHGLLDAASLKFLTSLCGLLLSIVYALIRKRQIHLAERAHEAFLNALHAHLPFRSVAGLQADANDLLRKQYAEVQRIGTDFFVNLGSVLEQKFSSGLEQHLAPLAAAIQRLADKETEQNEGAIGNMLNGFMQRLEGAVGESMRSTATTLQALEAGLSGLRGAMDDAASRMSRAAEEMAAGMNRGAQEALAGVTAEIAGLVEMMRKMMEDAGQTNRAAGEELAALMGATAEQLTRAVALFQRQIEDSAAQGIERLTGPLEIMLRLLRELAEAQRSAGDDATQALATTIARAAASMEESVARIADTLGAGASNASERLVAATEAMRDELRGVLERFGTTLVDAGHTVEKNAIDSGTALADAASRAGGDLSAMAAKLAEAGSAAGEALRSGGADARTHMAEAAQRLASAADALGSNLTRVTQAIDGLAVRATELQDSARQAAVPLQATAQELRLAATATREAAGPLAEAGQTLRTATEGMRQASTAMDGAYRQATTLASSLTDASDRFRGVDQVIGKATDSLGSGVADMARQVGDFVRGVDSALAKSVSQLHAIAEALEQTADSLADAKGRSS